MGEWSEYFEDFPEENPANWINGQFNPRLAQEIRNQEDRLRATTNKARSKINAVIMKAWLETKSKDRGLPSVQAHRAEHLQDQ